MEIKMPEISKTKTTYLGVISIVIGAWASACVKSGQLIFMDWPMVAVVGIMTAGRCFQVWWEERSGK